jgi:hypothetical protein
MTDVILFNFFNELRRFGSRLSFRLQVRKVPNLVDSLELLPDTRLVSSFLFLEDGFPH